MPSQSRVDARFDDRRFLPKSSDSDFRVGGCTEWAELGRQEYDAHVFDAGDVKVLPGVHYVVLEPEEDDSYYTFEADEADTLGKLRNTLIQEPACDVDQVGFLDDLVDAAVPLLNIKGETLD